VSGRRDAPVEGRPGHRRRGIARGAGRHHGRGENVRTVRHQEPARGKRPIPTRDGAPHQPPAGIIHGKFLPVREGDQFRDGRHRQPARPPPDPEDRGRRVRGRTGRLDAEAQDPPLARGRQTVTGAAGSAGLFRRRPHGAEIHGFPSESHRDDLDRDPADAPARHPGDGRRGRGNHPHSRL